MPTYRVLHTAIVYYYADIAAPDEATATGSDSYATVVENQTASEHQWDDSEVLEVYDDDDMEPDYYVGMPEGD